MIDTPRLRLRQWRETDRDAYAAMNADPQVMAFFAGPYTRRESDYDFDRQRAGITERGHGFWAVESRDTGAWLGFTGTGPVEAGAPIDGETEIGWRFTVAAWGHGYATEAARAALALVWEVTAAPRVVAYTAAGHARSVAVMQRLGMARRADLDFASRRLPRGDPRGKRIVYATERS